MKNLTLVILLICTYFQLTAQTSVHIEGQIVDYSPTTMIYISNGEALMPLKVSADGRFSAHLNTANSPSFLSLNTLSKRGKIEQLLPRIWFESDSLNLRIELATTSYQAAAAPYQELSEKIESLKGSSQIDFVLKNPNQWPSLFFADRLKENISLSDMKAYLQKTTGEYRHSVYSKRIESYLDAKSRGPLKKGSKIADFSLVDENNKEVSILKSGNKPKVIALLSSGCSYSVASIDLLSQLNDLNDGQLEIISIWEDSSKDTWLIAHKDKKAKISWLNLWDAYGFAATYMDRDMWPSFYVFDADGILVDKFKGYSKGTAKKLKASLDL